MIKFTALSNYFLLFYLKSKMQYTTMSVLLEYETWPFTVKD
jgi:hypothetical protein